MDLKEREILGDHADSHWYYRSKALALERMLPVTFNGAIVDIGAGSGHFSKYLAQRGLIEDALCIDTGYEQERDENIGRARIRFRRSPEKCDADVVLLMDVLEHVPDDAGLLADYRAFIKPAATIIITVPAFQFLYGGHDVFLGHFRRYTLASLRAAILKAGYRPLRVHYFYGLVFPVAVAVRLASPGRMMPRSNLRVHGRFTNSVLYAAAALEIPFMTLNRVVGLSVFAVCTPA